MRISAPILSRFTRAPARRTMAQRLHDLRPIAGGENYEELLPRLTDEANPLTDEELEALDAALVARFDEADGDNPDVAVMQEVRDQLKQVRAEQTRREEAAAEAATQAENLRNEVHAETPVEGEGTETPAEGEEALAETPEGTETPTEDTPEEPAQPEAVAAGANLRPRISEINARRGPGAERPAPSQSPRLHMELVAAANTREGEIGAPLDLQAAARAMIERHHGLGRGSKDIEGELVPVARFHWEYPDERNLVASLGADETMRRIQAVASPDAIVAAGGFCAPLAPIYDFVTIATADRPVRDSLPQFGNADRGGIRFIRSTGFSDISAAVSSWTVDNDTDALTDSSVRKPCVRIVCPDVEEELIEAIVQCLTFGNLNARTFPELVANALEKVVAWHARYAEKKLLAKIDANSAHVTTGPRQLGTTRDVLAALDLAIAAFRYRNRTPAEYRMRFYVPEWLDDNMRTDLAREQPGASEERLAASDQQINAFYANRGVNVTRTLDDIGDPFPATQDDGVLAPWPTAVDTWLFHEGAHSFLDGGTLDLGLVRDSTLNASNDYQMFSETFESVAFVGLESERLRIPICPDGSTRAPIDIDPDICGS